MIKFKSKEHEQFFYNMLNKSGSTDTYHCAFFYVMGISSETRRNITQMFDFKNDCIIPEGMIGGWQTSGSISVCYLAFNLWNGYVEENNEKRSTPDNLFCNGNAPYFMEGLKLRYPQYCRELSVPKNHEQTR